MYIAHYLVIVRTCSKEQYIADFCKCSFKFEKNVCLSPGKMAKSLKCLVCKHEYLSLFPETTNKSQTCWRDIVIQCWQGRDEPVLGDQWTAILIFMETSKAVRDPVAKKPTKQKKNYRGTASQVALWLAHAHTCLQTCAHKRTFTVTF